MTHNIMRSTLTPALFFFFRFGIKLLKCDSPFLSLTAERERERAQQLSPCKSISGRSGLLWLRGVTCDGIMQFKMTIFILPATLCAPLFAHVSENSETMPLQ